MYDLDFIDAETGNSVGTATRERFVPPPGWIVVLEHALFGPLDYEVTGHGKALYRARRGSLAKPDQYAGAALWIHVRRVGDPR
ncbi:hypothetical protein [Micromonospora sp. RP3T]|uniref:hypothetical protein n=1 Tax=Micromonospora sp. RP3T TaxID=2135446 RepID=UPI003D73E9C2